MPSGVTGHVRATGYSPNVRDRSADVLIRASQPDTPKRFDRETDVRTVHEYVVVREGRSIVCPPVAPEKLGATTIRMSSAQDSTSGDSEIADNVVTGGLTLAFSAAGQALKDAVEHYLVESVAKAVVWGAATLLQAAAVFFTPSKITADEEYLTCRPSNGEIANPGRNDRERGEWRDFLRGDVKDRIDVDRDWDRTA
jgi:hypothetical protein